ncbi:hypothetical protein HYFRA_00006644 [Hymenoscyphus fraxineus]|uniref:Uncharacterized protein n=1 Tax=Hymenoscyphus fraxineus TaxID=746836 RepID=A0A9N9KUJ7_9HELO|nr:hypothetical protein HYFRA_00006644 [Hymenoscyphus fraxineus]
MDGTNVDEKRVENASETTKGERDDDSPPLEKPVLDYGLGYGDFCFWGPRVLRAWGYRAFMIQPTSSRILDSNVVGLPELDSFKRSGYFDFERLPIDIRRHFFRLLLLPCLWYDTETRKFEFPVDLCGHNDILIQVPPSRHGNYVMKPLLPEILYRPGVRRKHIDYPFLEWIRQVSNVSKSFRKELADVLWERSTIGFVWLLGTANLETTMRGFMEDRPAACGGIKHLCFSVRTVRSAVDIGGFGRVDRLGDSYMRFCSLASKLRLETLNMNFTLHELEIENEIEDLLAERGDYATIGATRQIVVMDNFNLGIRFQPNENMKGLDGKRAQEIKDLKLKEKYQPMIRALMMPISLAKKIQDSETSEVGQYLRTRLG